MKTPKHSAMTPYLSPNINADHLSTSAETTQQESQIQDYESLKRNPVEPLPVYEKLKKNKSKM